MEDPDWSILRTNRKRKLRKRHVGKVRQLVQAPANADDRKDVEVPEAARSPIEHAEDWNARTVITLIQ